MQEDDGMNKGESVCYQLWMWVMGSLPALIFVKIIALKPERSNGCHAHEFADRVATRVVVHTISVLAAHNAVMMQW